MSGEVPVLTSAGDFEDRLLPGDILLFDKLTSLSGLVQWGDNRPVNHCGMWSGEDRSVIEATIKADSSGTRSGVFKTPLSELLAMAVSDKRARNLRRVRTITVMRHPRALAEGRRNIVEYAERRVRDTDFGAREMVLLTPFAVCRAYGDDLAEEPGQRLSDALALAIKTAMRCSRRALRDRGGPVRMFCSELAFRAYDHAGLAIDILDPLFERYQRLPAAKRGDEEAYRTGIERTPYEALAAQRPDDLLADYRCFFDHEALRQVEPDHGNVPPASTRRGQGTERGHREMVNPGRIHPNVADMVTPGDLWSSPSLIPVVVLHRPPTT